MKSPNFFEKIASLKIWWLVFFSGVKIHFGEKYAWFAIEILIHGSKSCILDVLWSPKIIKISSRYNTGSIWWEQYLLEGKYCYNCSVPEGDLHCQCILSIFPASMHQFYANILVFVNINPFLYINDQFALANILRST